MDMDCATLSCAPSPRDIVIITLIVFGVIDNTHAGAGASHIGSKHLKEAGKSGSRNSRNV